MIEKEQQLDQIIEQDSLVAQDNNKQEIVYYRPKFHRRVMANLVDIIIFAFLFVSLFSLSRYIATNTNDYKAKNEAYNQMKLDSGIFDYDTDGTVKDIVR